MYHGLIPLINFFNWKKLEIKSNASDSILSIAEKLNITKQIIKKTEENQHLIDPYDQLFEDIVEFYSPGNPVLVIFKDLDEIAKFIKNLRSNVITGTFLTKLIML